MAVKVWNGSAWGLNYTPNAPTASVVVEITPLLDGSDETAAIQAQINAAPDGTVAFPTIIRFMKGLSDGKAHTEGDLANNPRGANGVFLFQNRNNLIIEGPSAINPATFYTTAPAVDFNTTVSGNTYSIRRHFWFKSCTNILVHFIRVEGSNYTEGPSLAIGVPSFWLAGPDTGSTTGFPGYHASWELEHGFDITDCQGFTLEDCQVDSVWGDGVYLGNSIAHYSNDVTLQRLNLRWTGRQGIAMANCRNILVDDVTVVYGRRAAVDMEPFSTTGFVTDVEIRNCDLHPLQTQFAAVGDGDVSRINLHDNALSGAGGTIDCRDSLGLTRRADWTFTNNIRSTNFGSPLPPIVFTMTDNVLIDGNTIPIVTTQGRKCVRFTDCNGTLTVINNDLRAVGNPTDGSLYIDQIRSSTVTNTGNNPAQTVLVS